MNFILEVKINFLSNMVRLQMVLVVSFSEVAFIANLACVFGETLLTVGLVVEKFHMALIQNSSSKFNIAQIARVDVFHVRF